MSPGTLALSAILGVTLASALILALYLPQAAFGPSTFDAAPALPSYEKTLAGNATAVETLYRVSADVVGSQQLTSMPSNPILGWPIALAVLVAMALALISRRQAQ